MKACNAIKPWDKHLPNAPENKKAEQSISKIVQSLAKATQEDEFDSVITSKSYSRYILDLFYFAPPPPA